MMSLTQAEIQRNYRQRKREAGFNPWNNETRPARRRKQLSERPFIGVDGEGCGQDELGRQQYMLMYAGDAELFTGQPLSTVECLEFICDLPERREAILVGFSFGYDVTMILRDLPPERRARLLRPLDETKDGESRYVYYQDYALEYLPKQYFRVGRIRRLPGGKCHLVKGSVRTIYETFGFFQKSFVKALEQFQIGTQEQRKAIKADKARRAEFAEIGDREREYCKLECELLADLMEHLRDSCSDADIVPKTWNGAGKLAQALHHKHDTITAEDVRKHVSKDMLDYANMAYYGGRFEISRTGMIRQPVYEYDICSAYPANMRDLPCLAHGTWRKADGAELDQLLRSDALFVAHATFEDGRRAADRFTIGDWRGLPSRTKKGWLIWPQKGRGVYWSVELRSAQKLNHKIRCIDGFVYEKHCDCRLYDWVERLYEYRKSIGKQGAGYPIKLGINSLYGKLAQRIGSGKYSNLIHAGLITARTRAMLNDAIALAGITADRSPIVMVATDAVYSLEPLPLSIGDKLGDWEQTILPDLFVVMPGLYWSPTERVKKMKSRGVSANIFEQNNLTQLFETKFAEFARDDYAGTERKIPSVDIPVPMFVGLKLAQSRGKPDTAGKWTNEVRNISFNYMNKRLTRAYIRDCTDHFVTSPHPGSWHEPSIPHKDFLAAGGHEAWDALKIPFAEQPDMLEISDIWKE